MPDTWAGQHGMCGHCCRDVSIVSKADAPTNMRTSAEVTRKQLAEALLGVWDAIGGPGRWHGADSIGQCVRAALIIAETKLAPELAKATEEILSLREQVKYMEGHDDHWREKADLLEAHNRQLREVVDVWEHLGQQGVDVFHPDGATTSGPESAFSRLGDDYPMPLPSNETRTIGVDVVPWPDAGP